MREESSARRSYNALGNREKEEIIDIAKEYGREVTEEDAQELFDKLSDAAGELSDDVIAAVAGGKFWPSKVPVNV